MFRPIRTLLLVLVFTLPCLGQELSTQHAKIEIGDGETLVFLGDSITHQCLYTQYVEDFFYTRYPQARIRFHNSGVGGDKAADALLRFDEDVARYKPKYVTILLGMNDGRYTKFKDDVFADYETGMTELLDRIDAIGAAAVPMTPTMFDARAVALNPRKKGSELRERYYNSVLAFYGTWLREQSFGRGLGFVDMYSPLNTITFEQRKTDPKFTLIQDAVHPDAPGQVVMAFAILNDMHVNRQVSGINAQKVGGRWRVNGQKGKVGDVRQGDSLKFTFKANCLPWVLPEEAALGYKLTKAGHKMSNERLRVSGLKPGRYEVRIDGQPIGTYSHQQLGFKIELQENKKTPQYQQALAVAMLNQERNDKAVRPLRDQWRTMKRKRRIEQQLKANPDDAKLKEKFAVFEKWRSGEFKPAIANLEKLAQEYETQIYQANQPITRTYEIVSIKQTP